MEEAACNYNSLATLDDGSCEYLSCAGCTDNTACNFDDTATIEDGSCSYADAGLDCAGNCLADSDGDGVCDEDEVMGCQDETACNYDAAATDGNDGRHDAAAAGAIAAAASKEGPVRRFRIIGLLGVCNTPLSFFSPITYESTLQYCQ